MSQETIDAIDRAIKACAELVERQATGSSPIASWEHAEKAAEAASDLGHAREAIVDAVSSP